jgi:hypothetical protein
MFSLDSTFRPYVTSKVTIQAFVARTEQDDANCDRRVIVTPYIAAFFSRITIWVFYF